MWFYIVLALAKLGGFLIRLIDRKRGTDFPGRLALKLDRNFAKKLRNLNFNKIILVTGSNGKSTTTNLLYHTFEQAGRTVASNLKGSNMLNGVTTVFVRNCSLTGAPKCEYYILEVDERSFPEVYENFPARHVLVTNIMQDQVHRNGEPDFIYQLLRASLNNDMTLYLNNDEPRSKSYEDLSGHVVYYGVDENEASYHRDGPHDISMPCPKCHHKINFEFMNVANIGRFSCSSCAFTSEATPYTVKAVNYAEGTFEMEGTKCHMSYNAPVMLYNYAAVWAIARRFALAPAAIAQAFHTFVNVSGRMETLKFDDKRIRYIRMKQENPETLQGAIDAIAQDKSPKVFVIGLCTLDERRPQWVPHYANTYYAFDCDFKALLASGTEKIICFSEYVCYDIANRLLYDGARLEDMIVINSDSPADVFRVLDEIGNPNIYIITLMRVMENFKEYMRTHSTRSSQQGNRQK